MTELKIFETKILWPQRLSLLELVIVYNRNKSAKKWYESHITTIRSDMYEAR